MVVVPFQDAETFAAQASAMMAILSGAADTQAPTTNLYAARSGAARSVLLALVLLWLWLWGGLFAHAFWTDENALHVTRFCCMSTNSTL